MQKDGNGKIALITGVTGQDGAYLARAAAGQGLRRPRHQAPLVLVQHRPDRPPLPGPARAQSALHPALRRHDRRDQPDPDRPAGPARRDLQPRRPEPRAGELRDAGVHRQRRRPRHAAAARGDPHPRARATRRASTRPRPPSCTARCRASPQNETTPFYPRSPYGAAKLYAYWIVVNYREAYGHARLQRHPVQPREPAARRDLRHAQDHPRGRGHPARACRTSSTSATSTPSATGATRANTCDGMWLMLQQDEPDDYVLATGETTRCASSSSSPSPRPESRSNGAVGGSRNRVWTPRTAACWSRSIRATSARPRSTS